MYLLDTDTLVFLLRGDKAVAQSIEAHAADPKAVSVITFGELLYGAEKSSKPLENRIRVQRLSQMLPIIEVDKFVIETFSQIKALLEAEGNRLDDFDLLIAATAMTRNYTVVTNNAKHFERIPNLRIENWNK